MMTNFDLLLVNILGIIYILFTIYLMFSSKVLISLIIYSSLSIFAALIYVLFGALDVAITEAAIGSGFTTLLFVGALGLCRGSIVINKRYIPHRYKAGMLILFLSSIILPASLFLSLPPISDSTKISYRNEAVHHYIYESKNETGVNNVVTSILASYRALDTLGEIFVVFTGVIGVIMICFHEKDIIKRKSLFSAESGRQNDTK